MLSQDAQTIAAEVSGLLPLIITAALHVLGALAILLIGLWLAGKVSRVVIGALGRTPHVDEMLKRFFGNAARYLVLTVTVLAVLSQFGIQTTSFAAVLGAATLAIGLALQGTLSHVAAGVMLLIFRPFRIGHRVQIGAVTGTVNDLTLFWTEIVTDDKVQVIVPNGGVWGQPLKNFNVYHGLPSAEARFRIPETSSLDDVLAKVRAVVQSQPRILKDPTPLVLVDRSGEDNALQIVVRFSTSEADTAPVKSDLVRAVHYVLLAELAKGATL